MTADGNRRVVFGNPPGDPLTDSQRQAIDYIRMRRLRRAQHEVFVLQDVDEARVALDDGRQEIDHTGQHGVQGIGGSDAAADFVKQIDVRPSAHEGLALGDLGRYDVHVVLKIHMQAAANKRVTDDVCV